MKSTPSFNLFRWIRRKILPRVRSEKDRVRVRDETGSWVPARIMSVPAKGQTYRVCLEGSGIIQDRELKDVVRVRETDGFSAAYEGAYASMLVMVRQMRELEGQKRRMKSELARLDALLSKSKNDVELLRVSKEQTVEEAAPNSFDQAIRRAERNEFDDPNPPGESPYKRMKARLQLSNRKLSRLMVKSHKTEVELEYKTREVEKLKEEHARTLRRLHVEHEGLIRQKQKEYEAHLESLQSDPVVVWTHRRANVRESIRTATEALSEIDVTVPKPVALILMTLFEELAEECF